MTRPRLTLAQWAGYIGLALVALFTILVAVFGGAIVRSSLNPRIPFQTYEPPAAPDYAQAGAWAMRDVRSRGAGPASVFFVHSTTYDGGEGWNGATDDEEALAYLRRVVLPNYAAPFARAGDVSAPLYRQASLYARLTPRDDAREARSFAYEDVERAFDAWLGRHPDGPIILAGVEQGGELVERLLRERVAPDTALRRRVAAAYLIDTLVAADALPADVPACSRRDQAGCVVGWAQVPEDDDAAARRRLESALVFDGRGQLEERAGRAPLCVNPVTGSSDTAPVPSRLHHGATNATGLEWEARPALIARAVATQCRDGLLRFERPSQESFRTTGNWADRRKTPPYSLFYGDLELDAQARVGAWLDRNAG